MRKKGLGLPRTGRGNRICSISIRGFVDYWSDWAIASISSRRRKRRSTFYVQQYVYLGLPNLCLLYGRILRESPRTISEKIALSGAMDD